MPEIQPVVNASLRQGHVSLCEVKQTIAQAF